MTRHGWVDLGSSASTRREVLLTVAYTLSALGYEFLPSIDPRARTAHRFRRGLSTADFRATLLGLVPAGHQVSV